MSFQTLTLRSIRARPIVLKLKRPVVARIATFAAWPLASWSTSTPQKYNQSQPDCLQAVCQLSIAPRQAMKVCPSLLSRLF
jgi:hypothetical protein